MLHRTRRRWGALLLTAPLVLASSATISLVSPAPSAAALENTDALEAVIDAMDFTNDGAAIIDDYSVTTLAPGASMISVDRIEAAGRLEVDVLVADLTSGDVRVDYLYPGTVSDAQPLSEILEETGAVAGVNGSFFDINNSNAPIGVGVSEDGGVITLPDDEGTGGRGHQPVVFTEDGLGHFANVMLESTVVVNGTTSDIEISGLNTASLQEGNVALFDENWGDYSRARALGEDSGLEILVTNGLVTSIGTPGEGKLSPNTISLVARGSGASKLSGISVGDSVEVTTSVRSDVGEVVSALGANYWLLSDGTPINHADASVHPRTGIGFNEDGSIMYLVVVDGRQATSRGLSLSEFGVLFDQLGAYDAVNLDGGGSSTLGAVSPGDTEVDVVNNPSDGSERYVPNGIGLFVDGGSGEVKEFTVETTMATDDTLRVFPGLQRTVRAKAFDETGAAVASEPEWSVAEATAVVEATDGTTATVVGVSPGRATVTASQGDATGSLELQVLGELQRLAPSATVVQLPKAGDVASFTIYGYDENGYSAPIDAADLSLSGNEAGDFSLTPGSNGTYVISSQKERASASLNFEVDGRTTTVAVTVGVDEVVVFDFESVADWRTTGARSTSSVSPAPDAGRDGNGAIAMTYDFSQSTATRTANARPAVGASGFEIPGQPSEIQLWVKGESSGGKNPDTYVGYSDGDGNWKYIYGSAPEGDQWQLMSYPLPEGTSYPVTVQMVSAYETRASELYTGTIWFDDIVAFVPPEVELPETELVQDTVIGATGSTQESALKIAVLSDAQFVARDPDSGQVQGARDALREIVSAEPDVLVINGDFVDEASTADFELAQTILDEELAGEDFPVIYVPGNHEIMGGNIANFRDAFGDTSGSIDINGTRLIWLDTSQGSLTHDFEQVKMLQERLDSAASDPDITGVLVFQHMPIDDPLVSKASQLSNRLDAEMEREWLEEFKAESGKEIALIAGHVGAFHAKTEDGITYYVNGNSGKTPTGAPEGEFTGWSMLGINPNPTTFARAAATSPTSDWLTIETKVRVDSLSLGQDLAESVKAGTTVVLEPTITQDGSRTVGLEWLVSRVWSGSENVYFGAAEDAPQTAIAAFNTETFELTMLRAGVGSLRLGVNDASATYEFAATGITGTEPLITGQPQVGQTLTAEIGTWGPDGVTTSIQWYADDEAIPGATKTTLELEESLLDKAIRVQVTGSLEGYPDVVQLSAVTVPVAAKEVPVPTLSLSRTDVTAGDMVVVTGSGFTPDGTVSLMLGTEATIVAVAQADHQGQIRVEITVPEDLSAGTYTVRAMDDTELTTASGQLRVVEKSPSESENPATDVPDSDDSEAGTPSGDETGTPSQMPAEESHGLLSATGSSGMPVALITLAALMIAAGVTLRARQSADSRM